MASEAKPNSPQDSDVTRRTWLAAERTWLAWWRTGIGASAVAIGVGRIVPELTHDARWPFRLLGIAYGLIAGGGARVRRPPPATDRRGAPPRQLQRAVLAAGDVADAAAVAVSLGAVVLVAIRL